MANWQKGHSRKLFSPSTSAAWPLFIFLKTLSSTRFVLVSRGKMNQFSLAQTLISSATSGGASGRGKNTHRHNIFKRITHLKTSYGSTRLCVFWQRGGGPCLGNGLSQGGFLRAACVLTAADRRETYGFISACGGNMCDWSAMEVQRLSVELCGKHSMQSASSPFTSLFWFRQPLGSHKDLLHLDRGLHGSL